MATEPISEDPAENRSTVAKSLVIVNTGDGKGKSSSAFGMMVRAVAQDWNVAVVQFIKSGEWNVGEEKIGRRLGVDWYNEGQGFTWDSENLDDDKAIAQAGWDRARELIASGDHRLVILDELTYLLNWGWIDPEPVYDAIRSRPEKVSVIITGRDASTELIELADTVTDMTKVKHAFDRGIVAKKGLDF
jgi:cob(I)alamin adenosyltransferase